MPRRPLRCCIDLTIEKVSVPGVWLSSREDVYIDVTLFGDRRSTCLVLPCMPLVFHEKFRFEKVFYSALTPSEVVDLLDDYTICVELIQLSDYTTGGVRLASYTKGVRDFLYPYAGFTSSYSSSCRDVLMDRTVAFPGISPKLEFSTTTYITESLSPELDAFEDALEEEREMIRRRRLLNRSRSRSRSRTRARSSLKKDYPPKRYERSTVASVFRSRSPSPGLARRLSSTTLDDDIDLGTKTRPPFVVRHLDDSIIGRMPGGPPNRGARSRSRSRSRTTPRIRSRSLSPTRLTRSYSYTDLNDYTSPRLTDSLYTKRYYSEEDTEVANLTSDVYVPSYRTRPKSPLLSRPSLTSRYMTSTYTPPSLSIDRSLERLDRSLERLDRLDRLTYTPRYSSLYPYRYRYGALDDLELDLALARHRSHVPLDNGQSWTQKSTQYRGMSHRQLFNDSMSKIYNKLYKDAKKY